MKESIPQGNRIYFENLNAIRFIAAFLVIIHHTEHSKERFGLNHFWDNGFVQIIGKLGVVMFFVLSGFLISFLLFKEKQVTSTINIKHFYVRRLLKIWPLYFLIVFLAFFVFPHIQFFEVPSIPREIGDNFLVKILLYVFFLPNLVLRLFEAIPYVSHAWSIGAEEQFYLIWPVLNKRFSNKWILMFGVIAAYLLIKVALLVLPKSDTVSILRGFWESTPIDCMAIGGVFALVIFENTNFTAKLRSILFNKPLQWFVLILTTIMIAANVRVPYLHYEVYAVLFGILIVNFASNQNRIFSMENGPINYLGKISYGIYMYHPLAIVIAIKASLMTGNTDDYLIYPLVLLITFVISSLSFELFEKRFISMKTKYSKIISGNEAR